MSQPKWFTPARLLGIFIFASLFVYLDRGLIASNGVNGSPPSEENPEGTGIQGAFKLTYFQDGLLPAAFMLGLLLSAPVFAEASKHVSAFRLLAIGMGVWTVACVACGLSFSFPSLLLARVFVGVGEASFVALATPFIDDYAPTKSKTQWFGFFFLSIPVGFAMGYICGGVIAAELSWRWAFGFEALCMVPFVLFVAMAEPLHLRGSVAAAGKGGSHHPHRSSGNSGGGGTKAVKQALAEFVTDVKQVLSQRVWLAVCCGYTLYCAVLGVYAYWGPQAGKALFFGVDDTSTTPDLIFGGVTVATGVLGSLLGGVALDRAGSTLRNACLICACACLVGWLLVVLAFATSQSFAAFMSVFALGQLGLFALQAPVAALGMWTIPPALRPLGASLMTVAIHALGDVPSPPLLGLLQESLAAGKPPAEAAQQWRISMAILTSLLILAAGMFGVGAYVVAPSSDFRGQDVAPAGRDGEGNGQMDDGGAPLLSGDTLSTASDDASPTAVLAAAPHGIIDEEAPKAA